MTKLVSVSYFRTGQLNVKKCYTGFFKDAVLYLRSLRYNWQSKISIMSGAAAWEEYGRKHVDLFSDMSWDAGSEYLGWTPATLWVCNSPKQVRVNVSTVASYGL